ncbi:MAG: nucleotidyl transferase AbiEii/AbiGii toxin family protein [Lentisphaeria bacterium]|nr:nucleotidyl transferase AbiEii/AbiGii toxin family protein [Lentisphaeria bacterium]
MSLKTLFESAVKEVRRRRIPFAVAGGFACNLYRQEMRLTMDVDLVILADGSAEAEAVAVVSALGLQPRTVRRADLAGGPLFAIRSQRTEPCIVVGRQAETASGPGLDILLPALPWAADAVARAQPNTVDFGFGKVPTLTLEDVVITKLYALDAIPVRAKDLDDLQAIFAADPDIDMAYLAGQLRRFKLNIRPEARPFLPAWLLKMARDNRRADRRVEKA